jgi:protein-S-isoprenylcysteine O-methyltransferase Ste14
MRLLDDAQALAAMMYGMAFAPPPPGASDRLSVGLNGGDVPVFPPFFALAVVGAALFLQVFIVGRWRFMPWPLNGLIVRVAVFAAGVSLFVENKRRCEEELLRQQTYLQFSAVKGLVTAGPYAWSRNPLYVVFPLLVPALAVLLDSAVVLIASPLLPLYLDRLVIPAEERLLRKLFGKRYDAYCAQTPRWL